MSILGFALNFDSLGVLQSITAFGSNLPPLATVSLTVSGTAVPGGGPLLLGSAITDANGNLSITQVLPTALQLTNVFYEGSAYINVPQGIFKGDGFSFEGNLGDPANDVKVTVSVS